MRWDEDSGALLNIVMILAIFSEVESHVKVVNRGVSDLNYFGRLPLDMKSLWALEYGWKHENQL